MYLPKVILLMVLFLYLPLSHADQYGPLRNGESLWTIAPKVKPNDSITRHQMIIALLHANPHAFRMPCNINSLKIKQTLTIPSLDEIEKISHQQALEAYKEQNAAWKAFRRQGVEIQCEEVAQTKPSAPQVEATKTEENTPPTEVTTTEESSTVTAMSTQSAQKDVVAAENAVTLPKLSPPLENTETSLVSPENETAKEDMPTEAASLTPQTNYLPVIIVLAFVLFVFILAYLFRNHGENKPIPEDLT